MNRFQKPAARLAFLAVLGLAACDKPGADTQEKMNKAQSEASVDIAKAKAEADKKINDAQAEADKKIADAQRDFAKNREDYRHKMSTDLADLDKKLVDIEVKAKKATGKAKAETEASLLGIRSKRESFGTQWKTLDSTTPATWDSTKMSLDKSWSELKTAVDRAI